MNIYKQKKITEQFYMLGERITPYMFYTQGLVIGRNKVALIDTGIGISDSILNQIRQISDLPVICLLTHADPDHVGAAALFDTIYMNPLEDKQMKASVPAQRRLEILALLSEQNEDLLAYATAHIVPHDIFPYKNLADGMVFDLGGQSLEVISLPGHSRGSCCFYNRTKNYLLTGDAITRKPVVCASRCPSLTIYHDSLIRVRQMISPQTALYCGHSLNALPAGIIEDLICGCNEILSGKTQDDTIYHAFVPELMPKDTTPLSHICGNSVIQYNPKNLY